VVYTRNEQMSAKQSNPSSPRRTARAPYNFIPLPDEVLLSPESVDELPTHDCYHHEERHTGRIDCTFVTRSPLYVRSAVNLKFYKDWPNGLDDLYSNEEDSKNYASFFNLDELQHPVVPGSSLRGMIRGLMEIVTHGHMRWVGDKPTFTFRAVAAPRTDPLSEPYQRVIGRFSRNVEAGYLEKRGKEWFVRPAKTTRELNFSGEKSSYLKVREGVINGDAVKGFRRFDAPSYEPKWFPVCFEVEIGKRGNAYVDQIADMGGAYSHVGVLVCSGNMLETADGTTKSPRKNHSLVLGPNLKADLIQIDNRAIEDYKAGLTDFQNEQLDAWGGKEMGCLRDRAPIFFVAEEAENGDEVIRYFGYTPNFRIPARIAGSDRASNPLDFVPAHLRSGEAPDITESVFGWVEEDKDGLSGQRASRVFIGDATFVKADDGIWLRDNPLTLHTLSGPKPTTFQHYLVQDKSKGHDPDNVSRLAHFGSSPHETEVRGYKRYWPKGESPDIEASEKERKHPKQLTRVRPAKPGVHFSFSIRFENLSDVELGALLWTLRLANEASKPEELATQKYCHMLGMGKSLGMGVISMQSMLHLDNRAEHYKKLFTGAGWHVPSEVAEMEPYIAQFEEYALQHIKKGVQSFRDLDRIRALLTMLEWRDGNSAWQDLTRYQEIERGTRKTNEYDGRPVLSTPEAVAAHYKPNQNNVSTVPESTTTDTDETYLLGTVISFGEGSRKSHGYIKPENSTSRIIVHKSQLAAGVIELKPEQKVRYKEGRGPNGIEAQDVQIIN